MREVNLQTYVEEMRQLVVQGATEQAIAVGRHVLSQYPKHFQTYRVLGEACLEQGNFAEAQQLFARALACDPEDVFSRVGIAVARENRGDLSLAIWHTERAYELSPGNSEVRKELQRLLAKRDGVNRPRMKLTSGAVARLYARSFLWPQAIQEFRTLLQQNPDLVDLKVALAEAEWNIGNRKEAARLCQDILATYPHCLKANLILGGIWLHGENEMEGRRLLQLAQEIDPENAVAQKVFGERSPLPPRVVKVTRLEEIPVAEAPEAAEQPEEQVPAWITAEAVAPLEEEAPPESVTEEEAEGEEGIEAVAEVPPTEVLAAAEEAVPMDEALEGAGDAGLAEAIEEEEEIPEWLRRIRERHNVEEPASETTAPEAPLEPPEEEPGWLKQLRAEQMPEEAPATEAEEGVPDWLSRAQPEGETAPDATGAEKAAEPLPDWLLGPEDLFKEMPEAAPTEAEASVEEVLEEGVEVAPVEAEAESQPAAEVQGAVAEHISEAETEPGGEVVEAEEPVSAEAGAVSEPATEPVAETVTAEEELAACAEEVEAPAPEVEPEKVAPVEAPVAEAEAVEEVAAPVTPAEEVAVLAPDAMLAKAEELRDAGDASTALDLYERLIQQDAQLDKVLADLEGGLSGPLAQSRTYTLIGDLCMKQGRLQKALEAYRKALDMLRK